MSKRIVKETLSNGQERYRVENDTILGVSTSLLTDEMKQLWRDGNIVSTESVFKTYEEALDNIKTSAKVVCREYIYEE